MAIAPEVARESFYFFTKWMFAQRKGFKWKEGPHHPLMAKALTRVYEGKCKRLIINIPPRYSKTEFIQNFIAWTLGKAPDSEYIYSSYSGSLAANNTGMTKQIVLHPEYHRIFPDTLIRADSQAKDHWSTSAGGVIYASGNEGTLTGFGGGKMRPGFGGFLVIDDPIKPTEARNADLKRKVIEWFQETFESRKNDVDTPIIVIMQRLGDDDLSGWLKEGNNGEEWEVISLPALCESTDDLLGREIGEALWPEKHDAEKLQLMQIAAPYMFAGQYQQRPSPAEGNIFRPDQLQTIEVLPAVHIEWCRGWDFGSTVDGDFTVGAKIGRLPDGRFIIGDIVRLRTGPDERDAALRNTAYADGFAIKISMPQDPGQAGKTQVLDLGKKLSGFNVMFSPETGSKEVRAEPFASQVNIGNVLMLRGSWNKDLVDEMRTFPNSQYKDQVDACSRAFAEVNLNTGFDISPELLRRL